ncbi:hypothetical protein JB92DRAFT_2858077 [Gautieria morchelliformis]|nr:hypothetical protein JB92DRAFT_2858077 [Gautieria morchelliformis]
MFANHTSIASDASIPYCLMNLSAMVNQSTDSANAETALHTGMLDQYDRLQKLNAFLEQDNKGRRCSKTGWRILVIHCGVSCFSRLLGFDKFYCWIS